MRFGTLAAMGLGILLVGCPGGGETDETSSPDADETDDTVDTNTGLPLTAEDAAAVYSAAHFPAYLLFLFMDSEGDCPTVVEEDGATTVTTDCTDEEGTTWTGSASMVGEAITWNALTATSEDETLSIDGTQTASDSTGILTSDLEIVASFPDDAGIPTGTITYANHELDVEGYFSLLFTSAGDYSVSGDMNIDTIGSFTLSGTVSDAGEETCDREPDSGALTLTGSRDIEYTHDGDAACDGCIPYMTAGVSGTLCNWDWEEYDTGDTGGWDSGR
jgi:hypothetical protein